jgi:uncharacterized protein (DUF433 family)
MPIMPPPNEWRIAPANPPSHAGATAVQGLYYSLDRVERRYPMGSLKSGPAMKAEVVSDPTVIDPVVKGTRVPAETIIAYLRAGHSPREIFEDYPSLPTDGIDAVIRWAEATYGAEWRSCELSASGH